MKRWYPPVRTYIRRYSDAAVAGIAGAVVACLFIALGVLISSATESGKPLDLLTPFCTLLTTGIAFAAFVVARSWLPQLTTQEGYREAITLVNEQLLPLGDWECLDACLCILDEMSNTMHQGNLPRSDLKKELTHLESTLSKLAQRSDRIRLQQGRLVTYGLKKSPRYEQELSGLENSFRTTYKAALNLKKLLQEDFPLHAQYLTARKMFDRFKTEYYQSEMLASKQTLATSGDRVAAARQHYDEKYSQLTAFHKSLFANEPSIGALFVIRK